MRNQHLLDPRIKVIKLLWSAFCFVLLQQRTQWMLSMLFFWNLIKFTCSHMMRRFKTICRSEREKEVGFKKSLQSTTHACHSHHSKQTQKRRKEVNHGGIVFFFFFEACVFCSNSTDFAICTCDFTEPEAFEQLFIAVFSWSTFRRCYSSSRTSYSGSVTG